MPESAHDNQIGSPHSRSLPETPRPKVIRSDRIHYEGVDGRIAGSRSEDSSPRRLRPARDTGMSIERRVARQQRRQREVRRNRMIVGALALVALLILALGWRWASDLKAAGETPSPTRSSAPRSAVVKAADPVAKPTPIFATYKTLTLRLPVPVDQLTEVGFHQASYDWALKLKTPLPDADLASTKKKGTHRDLSKQATGPDAVLTGKVLRMWRSRPGRPDTAVDIGADPGTTIIAPLTGTVVLVKKYNLYNKKQYPDYQLHIQPDGMPQVDCVLIHVKDPRVRAGDRVTAGITPMGVVRKFSDRMNLQLEHYTAASGDHTHLQLNDATDPSYEGLKGAIEVESE